MDAYIDAILSTQPGSRGMTYIAIHAWWPYMKRDLKRDLLTKTAKRTPCKIGKNLKPVIPSTKCNPIKPCSEPNEEIQLDFEGPIYNERNHEVYFLAFIERFSKFLSVEVCQHANANSIQKFLRNYILLQGVPRRIHFDQARCQIGKQISNFYKQHNINVIAAPINDHRAIGLNERLKQTKKA